MPSRSSASHKIPAQSRSSINSGSAFSSTVTSDPKRRKLCASDRPVAPAPMTTRRRGISRRSRMRAAVRCDVFGKPRISGIRVLNDGTSKKRRARISRLPAVTVEGSMKLPPSANTRTPNAVSRASDSLTARSLSTARAPCRMRAKSMAEPDISMPNRAARPAAPAARAAAASAWTCRKGGAERFSPLRTSTVWRPSDAAAMATEAAAGPPPITHKSGVIVPSAIASFHTVQCLIYRPARFQARMRPNARQTGRIARIALTSRGSTHISREPTRRGNSPLFCRQIR
jgi:hypothetical protein